MHVLQSAAHPLLAGANASAAGPLSASFWLASFGAFGVFAVTIEIVRARRGRSGRHARHRRKAVPEESW